MADNFCGPSNGAKDLVAQVDRDRELHQNRLVNTANVGAGSSFRSQATLGNAANNAAVEAFQHSAGAMPGGPMSAAAGLTGSGSIPPMAPSIFGGPMVPVPASQAVSMPNSVGPFSMSASGQAGPIPRGPATDTWVDEFSRMGVSGQQNVMRPSGVAGLGAPVFYNRAAFGRGMAMGTGMGMPMNVAPVTHAEQAVRAGQTAGTEQSAFERAFAYYDDGRFDEERERWQAENGPSQRLSSPIPDSPETVRETVHASGSAPETLGVAANATLVNDDINYSAAATVPAAAMPAVNIIDQQELEFLQAQDAWMAQSYTQADRDAARHDAYRNGEIAPEEWAVIEADLTAIADEEDMQRFEGNPLYLPADERLEAITTANSELSRAAGDIVSALSDNQSDKFKNSSFVEMMRRIRAGDVTVAGNDLVDTATGKPVGGDRSGDDDEAPAEAEASGSGPRA